MNKFAIGHIDNPDFLISGVEVRACGSQEPIHWTLTRDKALHLEEEEAEALVTFVSDVIDWELAECLVLKPVDL